MESEGDLKKCENFQELKNLLNENMENISNVVLHSTYNLNKSGSENVKVGIKMKRATFYSLIQIIEDFNLVSEFDFTVWYEFKEHMGTIDDYFNDESYFQKIGNPVKLYGKEIDISFIRSEKNVEKAIRFEEKKINENFPNRKKLSEFFSNVIHESTFNKIKSIAHCVNAKLKLLENFQQECELILDGIVDFFDNQRQNLPLYAFSDADFFQKFCNEHMFELEKYVGLSCDENAITNNQKRLLLYEMVLFWANEILFILRARYRKNIIEFQK